METVASWKIGCAEVLNRDCWLMTLIIKHLFLFSDQLSTFVINKRKGPQAHGHNVAAERAIT